jgi:hypothetical protein
MAYSNLIPRGGFNKGNLGYKKAPSPGDALPLGVHSSLNTSSKHRRMVSSALHLKRESIGSVKHETAFKGLRQKAFKNG